ncbi:Uncharacterised protein [Mycobacteroides abscessus subsp. abscessus]|nr:Uncharacterised protein [Mycobacteroides abscessus subsp. abscessus]
MLLPGRLFMAEYFWDKRKRKEPSPNGFGSFFFELVITRSVNFKLPKLSFHFFCQPFKFHDFFADLLE